MLALTPNEANFILEKYNKEKRSLTYVGLLFLLFALCGPYLPSKVLTNPRTPFFPAVLFHLLTWALIYFIPLREFLLLRKDKSLMKKQQSNVKVIDKDVHKGIMSETHKIKVAGITAKPIKIVVSKEIYDSVKAEGNVLISYTTYSKTVLHVTKGDSI